jgi:hypothetical protein
MLGIGSAAPISSTTDIFPVPDESAPRGIGGVLATVMEIAKELIAERRVRVMRDLGARLAGSMADDQVCGTALEILAYARNRLRPSTREAVDSADLTRLLGEPN